MCTSPPSVRMCGGLKWSLALSMITELAILSSFPASLLTQQTPEKDHYGARGQHPWEVEVLVRVPLTGLLNKSM